MNKSISENPFEDAGGRLSGKRFIGREREKRRLLQRLCGPKAFGSIAVIGIPKIGKSSLYDEAILSHADQLARDKAVAVRVDIGQARDFSQLVAKLVRELVRAMETHFPNSVVTQAGRALQERGAQVTPDELADLFRCAAENHIRIICALDEFDEAQRVLRQQPDGFFFLRELASNPTWKAGVVLIAKRSLSEISRRAGHKSSYWSNVLGEPIYLRAFDRGDMASFYERLEKSGIRCDEPARQELEMCCASHPWLLDQFARAAFDFSGGKARRFSPEICREIIQSRVAIYCAELCDHLHEGPLWEALISTMRFGRATQVGDEIAELEKLGVLIRHGGDISPFTKQLRTSVMARDLRGEGSPNKEEREEREIESGTGKRLRKAEPADARELGICILSVRPNTREMKITHEGTSETVRFGHAKAFALLWVCAAMGDDRSQPIALQNLKKRIADETENTEMGRFLKRTAMIGADDNLSDIHRKYLTPAVAQSPLMWILVNFRVHETSHRLDYRLRCQVLKLE